MRFSYCHIRMLFYFANRGNASQALFYSKNNRCVNKESLKCFLRINYVKVHLLKVRLVLRKSSEKRKG